MKFNELYRLLEKDGWYIERTKRHHIYSHPTKKGKYRLVNMVPRRCRKEH